MITKTASRLLMSRTAKELGLTEEALADYLAARGISPDEYEASPGISAQLISKRLKARDAVNSNKHMDFVEDKAYDPEATARVAAATGVLGALASGGAAFAIPGVRTLPAALAGGALGAAYGGSLGHIVQNVLTRGNDIRAKLRGEQA